jgi:hypothetical protein
MGAEKSIATAINQACNLSLLTSCEGCALLRKHQEDGSRSRPVGGWYILER